MNRFQVTKRIAIIGITANVLLLILKLIVGTVSKSQALTADGFNSAGDVFASAMTFMGNKIASKPEDYTHPYGHGKAEYVFSMLISFSLILVAYKVFRNSINAILHGEIFIFSWWLIGIAVFTIVLKLLLFTYTRSVGRKHDNLLIIANSEDHRNDVFVTFSALLGIFLGTFKIYWVDSIVGIGISLWIIFTAFRIFKCSYNILMDRNMDIELYNEILDTIGTIRGVDHIDEIIAKPVGVNYIVIAKISVAGDMTVNMSHSIAAQVREKVRSLKGVGDVVVHINPA